MSEPSGFTRPAAWKSLDAPAQPSVPPAGTGPRPSKPKRRWLRRRPRHQGLGKPAGPDFSWATPAAEPVPTAPPLPPPSAPGPPRLTTPPPPEPRLTAAQRRAQSRQAEAAAQRSQRAWDRKMRDLNRALSIVPIMVGLIVLVVVIALVWQVFGGGSGRTRPGPTITRSTQASLGAVWKTEPEQLRPDMIQPEFIGDADGTFDDHRVIDAGATWVVLTGTRNDTDIWVHGLDAATGQERWRHPLDSGLCAADLLDGRLLCASAVDHDEATGLGTRWHLALLDVASGKELRGTDWTGWLTFLHVRDNRVLLAEQRLPAPHAVLTGLDAELKQTWQLDLINRPQHVGLFSDNRIYNRKLPIPEGPAFDRPRIRHVGKGLTAVWIGQTTVFVDLAKGVLVGMPRCSRLVDDGKRLWCNQGDLATSYSYTMTELVHTELNTRLAFPGRDPRAGDVTPPVFLREDGRAMRVDPDTGKTVGQLVNTRNGSAFGLVTSPRTSFVNDLTLVWDSSVVFAVRAETGDEVWQQPITGLFDDPYEWRGRILVASSTLLLLDPATGETVKSYRQLLGFDTVPLGDVLVGAGPDVVARLVDP